jgi:predicted ABC-type ATPase
MTDKRILIIADPNGAGKTTFASQFLPQEADCLLFVNADMIAAGLSPFKPEAMSVKAGRLMLEQIRTYTLKDVSFAFETTLSGRGYARMIPDWRRRGYKVKLFFLSLLDSSIAIARVKQGVREGGHGIPDEVVKRRFRAGLLNFEELYKPIVDCWVFYDNSGETPEMIEKGGKV